MIDWYSWIKMIFDFIKRLFGLVDEGARKRRADETDIDCPTTFVSPKKRCHGVTALHGNKIIYTLDNVVQNVEYLGESNYSPVRSKEQLNGTSCSKRKQALHQPVQSIYRENSVSMMNGKEPNTKRFSLKSMNAMSITDNRYSTLNKTNQLREKHEYGQLLQSFLPQRIHVISDKSEEVPKRRAAAEVIDLEKYETPSKPIVGRGSCSHKSRELFSTPKASTPIKWYTPRESMNFEPARAKTREKEAPFLGIRKSSKDKLRDDDVLILSTRRITDEKSGSALPRVKPKIVIEHVVDLEDEESAPLSRRTADETSAPSTSKVVTKSPVDIVPTNTLRDNLVAKAVMKQDFVPRITGHYNERIEQRKKDAEELERLTCLLSKHNRLTREAALETRLAQSMRLCEAVLDETAVFEDEALPTLTPPMLQDIKNALVPQPPNEVLVEGFGLRITRKDIHTLVGLNWLNDEVINFYMNLLIARGSTVERFPKVHAMNTFFYPKLLSGGHTSLKRWTRKIDIFAQDLLVVPIHLGIHWCMSIIDFRDKSIRYFDSMGGANPKCLAALRHYLEDESMDKKKKPFDTSDWKLESVSNIPQQMNGSDCGVFSCMFAEFICADRKITFTQEDMPYFRKKMVYEILKAELL